MRKSSSLVSVEVICGWLGRGRMGGREGGRARRKEGREGGREGVSVLPLLCLDN